MQTLIVVVHVMAALSIVGLVLLQQGKGADAGASFGAGASQTVFGSSGSGNFLVRSTTIAATIFFVTSLSLAIFARNQSGLGVTTGAPVVNPELIENAANAASDLPVLEDADALQVDLPLLEDADDTPVDAPLLPQTQEEVDGQVDVLQPEEDAVIDEDPAAGNN